MKVQLAISNLCAVASSQTLADAAQAGLEEFAGELTAYLEQY